MIKRGKVLFKFLPPQGDDRGTLTKNGHVENCLQMLKKSEKSSVRDESLVTILWVHDGNYREKSRRDCSLVDDVFGSWGLGNRLGEDGGDNGGNRSDGCAVEDGWSSMDELGGGDDARSDGVGGGYSRGDEAAAGDGGGVADGWTCDWREAGVGDGGACDWREAGGVGDWVNEGRRMCVDEAGGCSGGNSGQGEEKYDLEKCKI